MPLIVKTLARTKFTVPDVTEETKIEDIKLTLMETYNMNMDQILLIYNGKQLNNSNTVKEEGIYDTEKNIIISMVLSLRGGSN